MIWVGLALPWTRWPLQSPPPAPLPYDPVTAAGLADPREAAEGKPGAAPGRAPRRGIPLRHRGSGRPAPHAGGRVQGPAGGAGGEGRDRPAEASPSTVFFLKSEAIPAAAGPGAASSGRSSLR